MIYEYAKNLSTNLLEEYDELIEEHHLDMNIYEN